MSDKAYDTIYLLYGGTSADGVGPGTFLRWTFDKAEADKHERECRKNPYSTGGVRAYTNPKASARREP